MESQGLGECTRYNERLLLLKCRGSRGIGVPEQKRDIVKTRKMLRL